MKQPNRTPQLTGAALDLLDLGPIVQPTLSPRSTLDDQLLLGKNGIVKFVALKLQ